MGTLGDSLLKELNWDICQVRAKRVEEAVRILHKQRAERNKGGLNIPDFSNTEDVIKKETEEIMNRVKYRVNDYWTVQDNAQKVILGIPVI